MHPSICDVCGWIGHDGPKLECGHTIREHAEDLLALLKNGEVEVDEPIIIVVATLAKPQGLSPWEVMLN